MSIAQSMLPEFDYEMANTRKALERIPEGKLDYKPDPKSMSLGRLAGHVTEMVGWMTVVINEPSLNMTGQYEQLVASSRQQLLEIFDKNAAAARKALENCSDQQMMETWSLKVNGETVFSMPRAGVVRSMVMNHVIHHRAQLTVYFRLTGVPVPALYGPSGDEGQMAAAS